MELQLLPEPKKMSVRTGVFRIPRTGVIGISGGDLADLAEEVRSIFAGHRVMTAGRGDSLTIRMDPSMRQDAYCLEVGSSRVQLEAGSHAAAFYGLQTLLQIAAQSPRGVLPCLRIDDWPDFPDRGVYYDVCRGRVPKIERLIEMADILSHYKINQLQLYIEHTFAFRRHPLIGKGASPLTAEDILRLDAFCRSRHIELVPSLASFGHMGNILTIPQYRSLAEDWGVGRFVSPDAAKLPAWQKRRGWTLSPANPGTYRFLDSLFAEFLPLFSSERFNVCCDETWDLGLGQTYALCKRRGKGRVYLEHIKQLRRLAAKYGKKIMFWGDIIRHYPKLIPEIPRDVLVLDWNYWYRHDFDTIRDFRKAGLPFYACPGTSSWVSLFPRIPEATGNIRGFAAAAKKHGGRGILNTDWGDGGHYNFMEYSWHGYLFGAEQSWNVGANRASFTRRFARLFTGCGQDDLAKAIDRLGEISFLGVRGIYQSVWRHLLFAPPNDDAFSPKRREGGYVRNGRIVEGPVMLNPALARKTLRELDQIRRVFRKYSARPDCDPHRVLPYWVFAADTIACAARKLMVFGAGGVRTRRRILGLAREMADLQRRFETLWLARNRRSEIRVTLGQYRKAVAALKRAARASANR